MKKFKIKLTPINEIKFRRTWEDMGFIGSPATRVIQNKKGKGSYNRRKKTKSPEDE